MTDLACKRALVTGGSQYLGAAIAVALAERGADVVISYQGSADCAEETLARIESLGRRCHAIRTEGSDPVEVKRVAQGAATWMGGLDILVNNAGTARVDAPASMTIEDVDLLLERNMRRVVLMTLAAVPFMKPGGRIVMIGALAADALPGFMSVLQGINKAVHLGFAKELARMLNPRGITVNLVRPGRGCSEPDPAQGCCEDIAPHAAHGVYDDAVEAFAAVVARVVGLGAALASGSIIEADGVPCA